MASVKRRENKDGSVSYKIQVLVSIGADGKQQFKSTTWKPPAGMKPSAADKQAEKEAVLFEEKIKTGVVAIDGNIKFADYAAQWLEFTEKKPTTRARCERALRNHINPAIGHIPLEKIRPEHLYQLYKNMREDGVKKRGCYAVSSTLKQRLKESGIKKVTLTEKSGVSWDILKRACDNERIFQDNARLITKALKDMGVDTEDLFIYDEKSTKLSATTIRDHHSIIGAILNSAKKTRVLPHSIIEYTVPPRVEQGEPRYFDDEQARELLMKLLNFEDIRTRTAFILLLFTGLRCAELCGLEWRDIDPLDSKIHVRRTSNYVKGLGVYESTPKTKGSVRSIKVMPFMLEVLRQYKEWQNEQAAAAGDTWNNEKDRLFTSQNGGPIRPIAINEWAVRFHRKTGFPYFNPHALRHTFITLQIAAGTDIRTIQSMSGHSSAGTLLNVYSHAIQSAQDKAAAALDNMLLPPAQDILQLPQAAQSEIIDCT